MNKNTLLIIFITLLVIVVIALGSRIFFSKQNQAVQAPITKQQNANDQQGGPDLPGQAGKEAPGGANN